MRDRPSRQPAAVTRLQGLAGEPDVQVAYALELLERERGIQVVTAALAVVTAHARPSVRPVLLDLYEYYDAAGVKRDPGCQLREGILAALQPLALAADGALAVRALNTYEFRPPTHSECGAGLRAAGLLLLADLDAALAIYHATRLLIDPYTAPMSGQPALTAAQMLADQRQLLPLYSYLVDTRAGSAEVRAACLQGLATAPAPIVDQMVAQYGGTTDDLVLTGLFDLLLAHPARAAYADFITTFLRAPGRYAVYQYLATAIVASRQADLLDMLQAVAATERDPRKVAILVGVLELVQGDPAVTALVAQLRRRV
jgi:hypothetical protein